MRFLCYDLSFIVAISHVSVTCLSFSVDVLNLGILVAVCCVSLGVLLLECDLLFVA